jgi:uncharacterized protein YycO
MSRVQLLFCRSHGWSSPLLRLAMWSQWSHAAIILGDEMDGAAEATFTGGVHRSSVIDLFSRASKYAIVDVPCPNPKAAYEFTRAQYGKPYDFFGVIGVGLHRNWQQDDSWFCSELVEAALAAGGNRRFRMGLQGRITPQHSWMVETGV